MAKKKLPFRSYVSALWFVARRSFSLAPSLAILQLFDSLVSALLPIATTYYAALTTTALASAYSGDEGASSRALSYVIITAGLGIVSLIWSSVSSFLSMRGRYRIDVAVESELMQRFTNLPFHEYDNKETIDAHEKAQRFSNVFGSIFDSIGMMLTSLIGVAGSVVALLSVSPALAVIVLGSVLPSVYINIRLARKQTEHWETNITHRRRMWDIGWTLKQSDVMPELRVYGVIPTLIRQYLGYREKDEKKRMEIDLRSGWWQLGANVLEALVELGALLWVVLQIIDRFLPVGQFVFVQQMVGRAMGSSRGLVFRISRFDEEFAHMIDYQKFMEIEMHHENGKTLEKVPQKIIFKDVSFRYPHSDRPVLKNVSFEIAKGSKVAFVGENGAGKSSLIKLLLGLYKPSKGEILLDDTPLAEYSAATWHDKIGLLWQQFVKYSHGTIKENVELGDVNKCPSKELLDSAMKRAEFHTVVEKLERGVDTYIDKWMGDNNDDASATELSGGQYQRLAMARNFYRDAPIVVLDEPTSAIDALAETKIFKNLLSQKDKTAIIISHRLSTVQKADKVFMMENGKIVEEGTALELVEKRGKFYKMFESQL